MGNAETLTIRNRWFKQIPALNRSVRIIGAAPNPATSDPAALKREIATLQDEVAQLEQQAAAIDPTAIAAGSTANTIAAGQQRIQGRRRGDAWLRQQNGSRGDK